MSHSAKIWQCLISISLLTGMLFSLVQPIQAGAVPLSESTISSSPWSLQFSQTGSRPQIQYALKQDTSPPLADLQPELPQEIKRAPERELPVRRLPNRSGGQAKGLRSNQAADPVVQDLPGTIDMPAPDYNFEGLSNDDNGDVVGGFVAPPDTAGAVGVDPATGKKYYIQWVNIVFAIWDVSGTPTMVHGPAAGNSLWSGFGGICETNNNGDIIVLYDDLADRWFMSQFAIFGPDGHHQCVAISTTGDPLGTWYRYDFLASATKINDYPKFGIWPDGYYMTANQFDPNTFDWKGQGVWAFNRDQMLQGLPAQQVYFDLFETDLNLAGMLPSDMNGNPPPAGTPNYFLNIDDDAWGYTIQDQIQVWGFSIDWDIPADSTFTHLTNLATAPFDAEICADIRGQCIEQPNGLRVEDLADRLMYRLQYRNFGEYQALVLNHSVDVLNAPSTTTGQAGVRWYELRNSGSGWSIYQQSTYAPDGDNRFMGSISMDQTGNIALGYSVISPTTFPSIRYTGRLVGDPLGTLPQAEAELIAGTFSQEGTGRWGDYSMMTMDPEDDCTFWYTQEYVSGPNEGGWGNWSTRIGAFKYPTCTAGPSGTLEGTVTEAGSGDPIPGAKIDLGNGIMTFTDQDGTYMIVDVPTGTYTVTASAYGYIPETVTDVTITDGATTTQDFALSPAPIVTVSGTVTDAGHGWPLYARIDITAEDFSETIFTDPVEGTYSIDLLQDTPYTFEVSAVINGYKPEIREITPIAGGSTQNFALVVDAFACVAPGYAPEHVYFSDFEADDGGFTVTTSGTTSWEWGVPSSGPGVAHSGENVWATNLAGNYGNGENGEIVSPEIDLSAYSDRTIILSWWQWLRTEGNFDYASAEVSNDGGATWTAVFGPASGDVNSEWTQYLIYLDGSYAVSNFRVRFHLDTDGSVTFPGYYVDDVAVAVSDPVDAISAEDFEGNDGGYTTSGTTSWEWGTPTRGPESAHSGTQAWATNLDGNYEDNENGYLTSPQIDLSAYTGDSLVLSWWQWLQTEATHDTAGVEISNNGGVDWTGIYTFTGVVDTDWNQYTFLLDSGYLVSDFQVRFYLHSDESVNYPGFYLDDVVIFVPQEGPPLPPCNPLPGGLVAGNVYDANNDFGLNGATITSESGDSAVTFATPDDPNVDDGFYTLFAPAGEQTLTATKSDYGSDVSTTNVVLNDTVRQDFSLPAGLLVAAPDQLEAELQIGESTSETITLTNQGSMPASFELSERGGGIVPAFGSGAPITRRRGQFTPYRFEANSRLPDQVERPIPIHAPPWEDITNYPSPIMDNTAAELDGFVYSVGGFDGASNVSSGFVYDPDSGDWSPIASMSNEREKPAAAFVDELLYVFGGWDTAGNTVSEFEIYDPATDTWSTGAPPPAAYAAATAVSLDGQFYSIGGCTSSGCGVTDVFRYDPDSDTWTALAPYPEPTSWLSCGAIDGQIYCAGGVSDAGESTNTYVYDPVADLWAPLASMPQTQWAAGYTAANGLLYISGGVTDNFNTVTNETFYYDPAADSWSPDANSNHTVYRGGSTCGFYKIGGSTGGFSPVPSSEVYPGLTGCGAAADVPWLITSPITGTVSPETSQTISVTFDAGVPEVTQPGEYSAEIRVNSDTPYEPESVQVRMIVTAPPTWGKITGTITGLDRCDAPGEPLPGATVEISGTTEIRSDANGIYGYWLDQGSYTLVVSASGYISETVDVSVSAGAVTSQDISLRLDAPCAVGSPTSLNITLNVGDSITETLNLENQGAAPLTYDLLETEYDLSATVPITPTAGSDGVFSAPVQPGPASILSLAVQARPAGQAPLTPDTGWFGGLDLPSGVVRYAHAQCYEQPDSFYIISGVDDSFSVTGSAWRYDAGNNTWTELAPLPTGQEGPTAVCYQGKIYTMGGGGTDQFYIYDIITDSWSTATPLPRNVAGAAAGAWGGKIYLIGGDDDFSPPSGVSDDVDVYDIASGAWTSGAALPVATSFPGYVQAGQYVYVVGGWGETAPTTNITETLRYDMSGDSWESGPGFESARADFGLAVTDKALYAIAGDQSGGAFFDVTGIVERLDLSTWPDGAWTDMGDDLPISVSANSAGFCAEVFSGSAIWSVGGGDPATGVIYRSNLFHMLSGEMCFSVYSDVPWLSATPEDKVVPGDSVEQIQVTIDAGGLSPGVYHATLAILTNDPGAPLIFVPVTLTVGNNTPVEDTQEIYLPILAKH